MLEKIVWFDNPHEFIKKLIDVWVLRNASDIHITPTKEQVFIRFRISWNLVNFCSIWLTSYSKLLNTVKVLSSMVIDEHRHIQDWKMLINTVTKDWADVSVNIRVSTIPTIHWENTVMRLLLSNSEYLNINNLWFSVTNKKTLEWIVNMSDWLVLLCGWTWSWKTTTMYSLLANFDPFENTIFTLEDPVEYTVKGYIQSEVNEWISNWWIENNYTFQEWLVWILRQDPDIIMIWEIRRKEEASICLEAANTWHIVMWSTHANNSIWAITRLKKLWVEPYLLASSLKYIIFQKLERKLCNFCKKKIKFKKSDLPEKYQKYMDLDIFDACTVSENWCSKCNKWYIWNILISEIIKNDDEIYSLILSEKWDIELKNLLISKGFIPYYIDAFYKALDLSIDLKDVLILD